MNLTEAKAAIRAIDKEIDANHRQLCRLEKFDRMSAEGWQSAWDKHPDLSEQESALFRRRGQLQLVRDDAQHRQWLAKQRVERARAARKQKARKFKRCASCGSLVAA